MARTMALHVWLALWAVSILAAAEQVDVVSAPACGVEGSPLSPECLAEADMKDDLDAAVELRQLKVAKSKAVEAMSQLDFDLAEAEDLHQVDEEETDLGEATSSRRRRTSPRSSPATLAKVVERLWVLDAPYRLEPDSGYQLDEQNKAPSVASGGDATSRPLFRRVDESKLYAAPCTKTFLALLDNFQRETDKQEASTSRTRAEIREFVDELMGTAHMRYVYKVLLDWNSISISYSQFRDHVEKIWFTQYKLSRSGPTASSGFEHVFVGEEKLDKRKKQQTITGLHNWIQFWNEEKAGRINYLGYVGRTRDNSHLISARFEWKDDDPERETKSVSTMLVGSSVPFELAMLTCTFIAFEGEAKVGGIWFGNEGPAELVTYSWTSGHNKLVRTGYVEA